MGVRRWALDSWWFSLEAHGVIATDLCRKSLSFEVERRSMLLVKGVDDGVGMGCDSLEDLNVNSAMVVWQGRVGRDDSSEPLNMITPTMEAGEVLDGSQLEWVSRKLVVFANNLGFALKGCEREAVSLFLSLVQKEESAKPPVMRQYSRKMKTKRGSRELRRLATSVNYEGSSSGNNIGSRRGRRVLLLKCH